ncbi:MAG TPA: ABC transporter ATP-binding protein, partial [Aquella sp.]|nr:ABC transporter ATP-binding protein [Aquella sp.]
IFGGYSDWLRYKQFNEQNLSSTVSEVKVVTTSKPAAAQTKKEKLSYKENLELEQLPQKLQDLEKEQLELNNLLLEPDFYKNDQEKAQKAQKRITAIEEELQQLFIRWEELEQKEK